MDNIMNAFQYDSSLEEDITLYDHLPYERNLAVCGNDRIATYSGNVVKYATYREKDKVEVANRDEMLLARIQKEKELAQMKAELESPAQESELFEENL